MPTHNEIDSVLLRHWNHCKAYIQNNRLSAYRIYNRDDKALPCAIDIYQDNALGHIFAPIHDTTLKQIELHLSKLLKIKNFFYKDRAKKEGSPSLSKERKEIIVEEYGNKFHVNLIDYLDTGLFLDHRETRKWLMNQSWGKSVLNTFAYTGSFSVYAARGGAIKTVSVDISKVYCEWMKKNFKINELSFEDNLVYQMDTFDYFKYAKKKKLFFDIIVLDPPTFSRGKGVTFSVGKDHPRLLNAALDLLAPEGLIIFSNNYQDFSLKKDLLRSMRVEEKKDTIPLDFFGTQPHHCFLIRHA